MVEWIAVGISVLALAFTIAFNLLKSKYDKRQHEYNKTQIELNKTQIELNKAQLGEQNEFNRIQVRPFPMIEIENYKNKISVSIVNAGLGSLIIEKLTCYNKVTDDRKPLLIYLLPEVNQDYTTYLYDTEDIHNRAVRAGDKMVLIDITPKNDEVLRKLRNTLSNIEICLNYTDIYNSEYRKLRRRLNFNLTLSDEKTI